MSNTISQDTFIGGMSALFDSTKTPNNAYRIGLNCRARKNGLTGAFKPVKVSTPASKHQALFSLDTTLIVLIGGIAYKFLPDDFSVTPIIGFPALSATPDFLYHVAIPAPTNSFVTTDADGGKTYVPSITKLPEVAIIQDGVTQPSLVFGDLTSRRAKTYGEWTYDNPEYVPIAKQMCYAAGTRKVFAVSPDGKRIFQSVSGRGLDFVLNFNDATGERQGDAESTSLAVAASTLVALVASQTGGFIGFTRAAAYTGTPDPVYPQIFGEPYIKPGDLFPVGSVGHLGFTSANGESVFVSPGGIQSFNEVAQALAESNNTAFGAPILDFLVRPITRCCSIRADNYTFFGLDTIFGSGIAVFDNQLGSFVSFDLVGAVKQFALLDNAGMNRLFFITYTNELYELPLYSGEKSAFHVYFGEFTGSAEKSFKPTRAVIALNNVRTSADVSVKFFVDRKLVDAQTKLIESERPSVNSLSTIPVTFPTEGETTNRQAAFTNTDSVYGQSIGIELNCAADATLTSLSVELETANRVQLEEQMNASVDKFVVVGDIYPTERLEVQQAEVIVGDPYYFYTPNGAASMLNGDETITTTAAYECKRFVAKANILYGSAGAEIINLSEFERLLLAPGALYRPILLGGLGYTERISPILTSIASLGVQPHYVTGPWEHDDNARLVHALGYTGTTQFYVEETPRIRKFFLGFPMGTVKSHVTTSGALVTPPAPNELLESGSWYGRIRAAIVGGDTKLNVIFASHSPYLGFGEHKPGVADFRWNFKRLGIHAVISANSNAYYRTYVDGVHFIAVGNGNNLDEDFANEEYYAGLGALRLVATSSELSGEFYDADNRIRDRFFVPL